MGNGIDRRRFRLARFSLAHELRARPGCQKLIQVRLVHRLQCRAHQFKLAREILVVEDVIDTGLTLSYLLRNLEPRAPASLKVCVLLDKPARRIVDLPIAYRGFEVPDKFVVGYGLDYRQRYRNLPYIGILTKEAVDRWNRQ